MIWRIASPTRYFLIPDHLEIRSGTAMIIDLMGNSTTAAPEWLAPFEVTETQARRIAKAQLGQALEEIRGSIDETLAKYRARVDAIDRTPVSERTTITPGAVPALIDLIKELPQAIGGSLSRDEGQLSQARQTLTHLEARLKASGIDLDGHLERFADRLASLRTKRDAER
jgi:hypothetical protein